MNWFLRAFDELTTTQLYRITELRERVFVVEQNCVYLDADGLDLAANHLWCERDEILAYARILPAGVKYVEVSIGRVITAPAARGTGLGKELMTRAIAACGGGPIRIGAQAYLEKFYTGLGFERVSENYLEDDIPHLSMLRPAGS